MFFLPVKLTKHLKSPRKMPLFCEKPTKTSAEDVAYFLFAASNRELSSQPQASILYISKNIATENSPECSENLKRQQRRNLKNHHRKWLNDFRRMRNVAAIDQLSYDKTDLQSKATKSNKVRPQNT